MSAVFTCVTCHVAFRDSDVQRDHYKTEWHRYNLKRKVAELPPITMDSFQVRAQEQRAKEEPQQQTGMHCRACCKSFTNQNAHDNHLMSKKHITNVKAFEKECKIAKENGIAKEEGITVVRERKVTEVEDDEEEEEEVEEVDSDEWDECEIPISVDTCLFCTTTSADLVTNLHHMTQHHSFYLPDIEYLTELEGLISYLGEKVGQGRMCLWCSERGRSFQTVDAVQRHMRDKGHCKLIFEGEALLEYSDFYDYSSSYPQEEGEGSAPGPDDEVELNQLGDDNEYELTLPSGAVIGHRALVRYYKQRLSSNRAVVQLGRSRPMINDMIGHYRSMGWIVSNKEAIKRKAKDVHFMKKMQSKHQLNLGVKANKFQPHFRAQVNF